MKLDDTECSLCKQKELLQELPEEGLAVCYDCYIRLKMSRLIEQLEELEL